MKRITRTVTKTVQETVSLCDACEQEKPLVINGSWRVACRSDTCYDDCGSFEFCSVRCFLDDAQQALDNIDGDDTFFESLSIHLNNDGDEFRAFVTYLKGYGLPTATPE